MYKTKIKHHFSWQRILALTVLGFLIIASIRYPLSAQTVTEGFNSDQTLQRGMLVKLKDGDGTKVEPASSDSLSQLHGVVVNANDSPVTISSEGQKVFVATSGHYDVLVNTQNGAINTGDYITASSLAGIGMKATERESFIVGRAIAPFDGKSNAISKVEVKDSNGNTQSVSIGRVQVDILIAKNPLLKDANPNVPTFLLRAAETISGKPVSAVKVYLSVLILLVATVIASSLLYGGVRSGIIAIGRNPLSKSSVIRGMAQVIITGLIVFIGGVFGVYLLLRS